MRTHKSESIESLGVAILFELHAQLVNLGILLWGSVSRMTILLSGRDCRVVIMVVRRIERLSGLLGRHIEGAELQEVMMFSC